MPLTINTLWANSADDKFAIFPYFFQKIGLDILCKLSSNRDDLQAMSVLFSRKNKKNIFPENDLTFCANCLLIRDNLKEMSSPVFWENKKKLEIVFVKHYTGPSNFLLT